MIIFNYSDNELTMGSKLLYTMLILNLTVTNVKYISINIVVCLVQ